MQEKTTDELIVLWARIEELKQGYREVLAFMCAGKAYLANRHRTEGQYYIDDIPASLADFEKLQNEIATELTENRHIVIKVEISR